MRYAALMLLSAAVAGTPLFMPPLFMASDSMSSNASSPPPSPQSPAALRLFVGTYTNKGSKGIYTLQMDPKTGQLSGLELAAETENPSFLVLHPSKPLLYAVNEVGKFEGADGGGVTAFSINANGTLTKLNAQSTKGGGPCYLALDKSGRDVLVANYGGGNIASFPVDASGKLLPAKSFIQHEGSSVNQQRQKGPHAHSINIDPSGKFAVAADLGVDKLFVYGYDANTAALTAHTPPAVSAAPGAGPRHLAFHPNGKIAYVINELSSTVVVYAWDAAKGTLTEKQSVRTLPADFTGETTTAEIQVHPSGRFVYGSNRGHDSISIFSVNAADGQLTFVGTEPTGGKTPRNFRIDPSGQFLVAANQNSDSLVVFRIDQATGKLTPTGASVTISQPVCIKFQ